MINEKLGVSGKKVLIEEFLEGFEISYFTFIDKNNSLPLGYALDHKKELLKMMKDLIQVEWVASLHQIK